MQSAPALPARLSRLGALSAPIHERFPCPSVMGIVNVTPDSFSDGGVNFRAENAIASARRMAADGAAIVDVGGESTRPGADPVSLDEELRRVVPVLEGLAGEGSVSIDTAKAEVARRALDLGAELVNDVTALRGDPELAGVVANSGSYFCLMHMLGEPRTMQVDPRYEDVVAEVAAFLEERLRFAVDAGIAEERICLDRAALGEPRRRRRRVRARCDDPPRARRPRDGRGADRRRRRRVIVELEGLEVFGRHGVEEDERREGRVFLCDVRLEVSEEARSDRIEDA